MVPSAYFIVCYGIDLDGPFIDDKHDDLPYRSQNPFLDACSSHGDLPKAGPRSWPPETWPCFLCFSHLSPL